MITATVDGFVVQQRHLLPTEAALGAEHVYSLRRMGVLVAEVALTTPPDRLLCTCKQAGCAHRRAVRQLRGSWAPGTPPMHGGSQAVGVA